MRDLSRNSQNRRVIDNNNATFDYFRERRMSSLDYFKTLSSNNQSKLEFIGRRILRPATSSFKRPYSASPKTEWTRRVNRWRIAALVLESESKHQQQVRQSGARSDAAVEYLITYKKTLRVLEDLGLNLPVVEDALMPIISVAIKDQRKLKRYRDAAVIDPNELQRLDKDNEEYRYEIRQANSELHLLRSQQVRSEEESQESQSELSNLRQHVRTLEERLARLSGENTQKGENEEEEDVEHVKCAICQETLPETNVVKGNCECTETLYHHECLTGLLAANRDSEFLYRCPCCRKGVDNVNITGNAT
jgi:hypothetical protein